MFKPRADLQFYFNALYDVTFTQLIDIQGLSRIVLNVNGVGIFDGLVMTSPIIIHANDVVGVRIYKNDLEMGTFKLIGSVE